MKSLDSIIERFENLLEVQKAGQIELINSHFDEDDLKSIIYYLGDTKSVLLDVKKEMNKIDSMQFVGMSGCGCASEMKSECLSVIDKYMRGDNR